MVSDNSSPYLFFSAKEWAEFRGSLRTTFTEDDISKVLSLGDTLDVAEVDRIYLPLARLLLLQYESRQHLLTARNAFLQVDSSPKIPFIIGVAGSVAVGKSTTSRLLKLLLHKLSGLNVELVTTDGFLYPNARLTEMGIMDRKGFPESYDMGKLLRFLSAISSGCEEVSAPVYSHLTYDIIPDEAQTLRNVDILIFEGINVLQVRDLPKHGRAIPFVSDFFAFSIYIDAEIELIAKWYLERFMRLRETAFQNPKSFFSRYANWSEDKVIAYADRVWHSINYKNLIENILPTRPRADLILTKGSDHYIQDIALRKL